IAGQARGQVEFSGAPRHAGTTPMDARDDALCSAAEFVLQVRDAATGIEGAVATVGNVVVEPGAANVVPGRVTLTVDARAPDQARLDALLEAIGAEFAVTSPVAMDSEVTRVLGAEIERLGLPVLKLASGAGHDAGILAASGVRAGMLFVRSVGGISHAPEEHTSPDDIALCVAALTAALGRLAR
ncbi:MAG TPA: M20/M25/M40 family metallo-hydrolase, partial [Gaiellaceae bacterium]|nr:M20/M25/M40 family metallo-hydrolase [Gaiellaceae bacterium]